MRPIPLFVELCAGLASVSGVLQHGSTWKPPISRMGRKSGYADAILRVMGLRPRQGAAHYLWAEADSDVAALLAAYTQPEMMRQIADIIRSWIPCPYGPHKGWCSRCKGTGRWDARDLWETLRREKRRGLWEGFDPADVAAWTWTEGRSIYTKGSAAGFLPERSSNGVEVWNAHPPEHFAALYDRAALPWPPVLIAQDARIGPGEVAALTWLNDHAFRKGDITSGWQGNSGFRQPDEDYRNGTVDIAAAVQRSALIWPPVHLTPDATIQPADALRQMRPQAAALHGVDRGPLDAVARHEDLDVLLTRANITHSSIVQQGASVLLTHLSRPMLNLVGDVLALRAPSEVVRAVVRALAVIVADDMVRRSRTMEGDADQHSHAAVDALAAAAHHELPIAVLVDAAAKWAHRVDRPDLAVIGDLILGTLDTSSPLWHDDTPNNTVSYGGADVKLPAGIVVFCDPPYQGTTGYKHDLPRADVIAIAERWHEAGARVYISEAEPLPIPGWHHVEIGSERRGQKRTFGDTQEWLTCSHPPAWTPPKQGGLFG